MNIVSYTQARQNLADIMDKVTEDSSAVIITRQKASSVVMMSLEDYNSIQETMYLLGNPANTEHLQKSLAELEAGKVKEMTLNDLENL